MAISLKHSFNSPKADGPDTTLVQPSNWNAEHTLTMATNRLLGRTTAATGAAEEISVGSNLSLATGTLNLASSVSITALTASGAITGGSLRADTITNTAGSGAPSFSQGLTLTGGSLKADTITNGAGTGAPNFPNGLTLTGALAATTLRGDTITNNAGTGAPVFSQGIKVGAIVDASGGNTATINGILPISAAQATGMTLLGTMTTTSGTSQTLSSLVLTGYKYLLFELDSVSHSSGTNQRFQIAGQDLSSNFGSGTALYGIFLVSLASGMAWGSSGPSGGTQSMYFGLTGYTTATTSVSVAYGGATFDLGSVRVYGVK